MFKATQSKRERQQGNDTIILGKQFKITTNESVRVNFSFTIKD